MGSRTLRGDSGARACPCPGRGCACGTEQSASLGPIASPVQSPEIARTPLGAGSVSSSRVRAPASGAPMPLPGPKQTDTPLTLQVEWFRADGNGPARVSDDQTAEWEGLSYVVYAARQFSALDAANDELERAVRGNSTTPFAPLYRYWITENLVADGRLEEAIECADKWIAEWPHYRFEDRLFAEHVLRAKANCHRLMNDFGSAKTALEHWIRLQDSERRWDAEPWYLLGLLTEEMGDRTRAISAYREAGRRYGQELVPERARRNAARLQRRVDWVRRDPRSLARELLQAVRRADETAVWSLASKTHFMFGVVGGHFAFTEPKKLVPLLMRDIALSKIQGDPDRLLGSGGKRYLVCSGWRGETFAGRIQLVICETRDGWEWGGIATEVPTAESVGLLREAHGVGEAQTNREIQIPIKAPWPSGLSFQAGGWRAYTAAMILGGPVAVGAAGALRECGFGPSGYYYTDPPHENKPPYDDGLFVRWPWSDDQFAVDFARWQRGNPFPDNLSAGTPVLACAAGRISSVRSNIATGDTSNANEVLHRLSYGGVLTTYTARYVHLDGPGLVGVYVGMYVNQGWVLGLIDDTGTSIHPHLHFEVHDSRLGNDWDPMGTMNPLGRTVRLDPIDDYGQRLHDGSEGACVMSTNAMFIPTPDDCASPRWLDSPPRPGGLPVRVRRFFERLFGRPCATSSVACVPPNVACVTDPATGRGGFCTDLQSDPRNCGACGRHCGVDDDGRELQCVRGDCVPRPPELLERFRHLEPGDREPPFVPRWEP